jgi:hypothetical protein
MACPSRWLRCCGDDAIEPALLARVEQCCDALTALLPAHLDVPLACVVHRTGEVVVLRSEGALARALGLLPRTLLAASHVARPELAALHVRGAAAGAGAAVHVWQHGGTVALLAAGGGGGEGEDEDEELDARAAPLMRQLHSDVEALMRACSRPEGA